MIWLALASAFLLGWSLSAAFSRWATVRIVEGGMAESESSSSEALDIVLVMVDGHGPGDL